MAGLAFEDFWGDVVGCATNGLLLLAFELELGGESEIAQLDFHLVVKEEIAEFEVAMDHTVGHQVLETLNNLD